MERDRADLQVACGDPVFDRLLEVAIAAVRGPEGIARADEAIEWVQAPGPPSEAHPAGEPAPVRRHADYNLTAVSLFRMLARLKRR